MIFLVQTPHAWRGIYQRPHHLMARFARRGHCVRWVETRYLRWLLGRSGEFWRARVEEPAERFEVRPVTLINGERLPFIRAHNKFHLARALKAPLPREAEGARVLWLYNPHEAHLADRVPHDLLVYDIMDEYAGFPWSPPNIVEEERALLRRADWIFADTRALFDAKRPLAEGRIECILSGVETEHFARGAGRAQAEQQPDDQAPLRARYRKLIGYAGMIDLRIDQGLLTRAARAFPEWGFVMIGPAATGVAQIENIPNVHLLGQKAYRALPAYYHGWDAAMLPFIENELTRHINPTKMLEYAAAGLPIVTRALPDVRACYADGAWLYETEADFWDCLKTIEQAGAAELEVKLAVARSWADERSWDTLAGRMIARVSGLLGEPKRVASR